MIESKNSTYKSFHILLKQAAFEYWKQGLYVVPFKWVESDDETPKVQPLVEWGDWEQKRQTLEEFEALPWRESEGFALVCGDKTSNGLYLGVLDFDKHNTTTEAQQAGRKVLKELLITRIEITRRGGEHWVYYCRQQPRTVDRYRDQCALELLGKGHLVVMAPSDGYRRLNDNTPTVVQDLEAIFYDAVKRVGIKESVQEDIQKAPAVAYTGPDPACIKAMLKGTLEGNRDNYAIRLACYWLNVRHLDYATTLGLLREWNKDNKPPLEDKTLVEKVKSASKGGYVYGCKDSILASLCANKSSCPLAKKFSDALELIEKELEYNRAIKLHPLLDFHPDTGLSMGTILGESSRSVQILSEKAFIIDFEASEVQAKIANSVITRKPRFAHLEPRWNSQILLVSRELLSGREIKYPAKNEVFEKTFSGLSEYWYHSDSRWLTVVTCWTIATYLHPIFVHFPALNPQGERESGKTTLLEVLRQSAWNPTGREAALRGADLFRTIEGSRVTYLADVTRISTNSPEYIDVVDIIESGTEKGGQVRRIDKNTGEPLFFDIYGPKAIASRYELPFGPKVIRIITEKAPDPSFSRRRAYLETDQRWDAEVAVLIKGALKYWREVYETYVGLEQTDKLVGRHFNYWAPILAVCKVFAPKYFNSVLELAEEYAEKSEKGDLLSEVEDAVLIALSSGQGKTTAILLKDLTNKVQEALGWVKDWHIVKSAVDNLGIVKKKYDTTKGVVLDFDLERVKARMKARGITLEEPPEETEPAQPGICEVCGQPGGRVIIRDGRLVCLHPGCEDKWKGPL